MKMRSHILNPSVARGIAVMCAAVFAATAHPAYAGINVWTSRGPPGGYVSALAIDPITPSTLYAVTDAVCGQVGCSPGGVFKSTDAGATWSAANAGLTNTSVSALAVDPIMPRTLYAGTASLSGVFRSTDAGTTWSAANAGLPNEASIFSLAIDPSTPSTLYTGGSGGILFKSTDAGLPNLAGISALVIDPITPRTLYAGTQGGVFKSTDAGSTWNALNTGLTTPNVLAIDPLEPRRVYAGTYGGGVFAIEQVLPSCVGDCAGADTVAINDLVTLVNIALGTTQPSACPNGGLPLGGEVDVAVIIQAVNNALNGCGVGK
jgi:hypothetical protein